MLKKFFLHKLVQLLIHFLFWIVVLLFYTYFFGFESTDFNYVLSFSIFLMPITIVTTYVFIYKIIPQYLITKRYFKFVLYSTYTLIISAYLIVLSLFFGLIFLSNLQYSDMAPISRSIFLIATGVYLVVIIVSAFKLLKINLKQSETSKKLETQILKTQLKLKEQELKYLKMQIHPHFLFNTLNTIYGFSLKKADETPEMILKLSNLLDYILYKLDKPFVSLKEEITHIKDYIELEKIRFNNSLDILFNTENIPETANIAPMLLIPFVENSFKHGALINKQLKIKIDIRYKAKQLFFYIENTTANKQKIPNRGIGLENIKKRLTMIYPNKHTLNIETTNALFKVTLQLDLT